MRKRRYLSLRMHTARMIVSLMVALMMVLIVSFSVFSNVTLVNKTTDGMVQNLHLISQKLDMLTRSVEDSAVFMLTNDSVQQWLKMQSSSPKDAYATRRAMASYLVNVSQSDYITNVALFACGEDTSDYAIMGYTNAMEPQFLREFHRSSARSAWRLGQPVIRSLLAADTENSPNALTYYHKVFDKWTMEPLGVLAIMVSERHIADLYKDIVLGRTGYCYIQDEGGTIVSSADKSGLGAGPHHAAGNGENVVVSISYPKLGWEIIGFAPRSEITGDNRFLWVFALGLGTAVTLLGAGVSGAVAGRISRPIVQLKEIVLGGDAKTEHLEETMTRNDEIGSLYRAFFRMREKNEELTRRSIEDSVKQKEYELNLAQAQLNPHFLYNTLECICGLSLMGKNEDVVKATTELALFYRGVLSERSRFVPVRKEMEMVRRYLGIIQYRFPSKLHYKIVCGKEVQEQPVVKLSLQPIVENAVLHGLRNSRVDWEIEVRAYRMEEWVEISVWDNGVGMSQEQIDAIFSDRPADRFHFGLRTTDNRIKLACGRDYGLQVFSQPGEGTLVVVKLPVSGDAAGRLPPDYSKGGACPDV